MITRLLGLVPFWAWALAIAAAAAAAGAWHLLQLDAAREEGRAQVQALWDRTELARAARARAERDRTARQAQEQAAAHEAARAAIAANLVEARHALRKALSAPISCPAGQSATLGDLVVPGAALERVRAGARGGAGGAADRPPAGQPGRAVP